MADPEPQTLASPSPDPASASSKKKKKRNKKPKAIEASGGGESSSSAAAAATEDIDVAVDDSAAAAAAEAIDVAVEDPVTASSKKKKKKKKKKSQAVDASLSGESSGATAEDMDVAMNDSAAAEDIDVAVDDSAATEAIDVVVEDPVTASSKKKKKKKKKSQTVDASLSGESSGAAAEDMDVAMNDSAAAEDMDVPMNGSAAAKAKAIDDAPATAKDAKAEAEGMEIAAAKAEAEAKEAIDVSKAKAKTIDVTVDASITGGSAAAAAAPVVGYFPSGYDPLAAGGDSPNARLFRHVNHPTWVDLVVRGPGGGPDFVGKSYAGEAAMPQLCNYALGVLDKATGTLKVVPIAGDKILRLEPYLEVQKPAHPQLSGVASEAGSAVATGEMGVQTLTSRYGAKKDKDTDKKWMSLNEQTNDPSAYEELDLGQTKTNADSSDNQASVVVRNIPPYDPSADTSEKAYLFDEIIPKNIRSHLEEILDHLQSGELSSKGYGKFVSNRVHKLENLQGDDKKRLAWILSYITHLLTLLTRNNSTSKWRRKENEAMKAPAVPQAVYRKLLVMFTEEGSSSLSTEKHELLINYILVLTLFADDFRSDPSDIGADLKMTRPMLKPYYDQLGCKSVSQGAFQASVMTLPAPLKFPKDLTRKRKRR